MSRSKRKSFSAVAFIGMMQCVLLLFLLIALGAFFVSREVIGEDKMNIIINSSVILSIFISGKTISGVWGRSYLLCNAISAVFLIVCMWVVCALAGTEASFSLEMLENSGLALAAAAFGTFVQFCQKGHSKKRRKN